MIEQQARVVRHEGEQTIIRLGGQSGCSACDAGKGCGAGLFGRLLRRRPAEFGIASLPEVQVGEAVMVGIEEGHYVRWVSLLYGVPLLSALFGAAIMFFILGSAIDSHSGQALLQTLPSWASDGLMLVAGVLSAAAAVPATRRRLPSSLSGLSLQVIHPTNGTLDCVSLRHH